MWIGKGQFGFLDSHGNSDAESVNGNIDMTRYDGAWKNEFYAGRTLRQELRHRIRGALGNPRCKATTPSRAISLRFGGLRFEHDLFDGFQYQASATGGLGYKFIDTDSDKLVGQIGAGYRRLRPEEIYKDPDGLVTSRVVGDATGEAIGTAGLDFSHAFTKTTVLTNKFLVESGSTNTMLQDDIALTVKMSNKLALSVGYGITNNSNPPPTIKKLDTVATVNVVFALGPQTL